MGDLDRFINYRNDAETAYLQGWPTPFSAIDAQAFILSVERDEPGTAGRWFQFAIADRATDVILGDIGLYTGSAGSADSGGMSRLGYTIHPDARGNGHALEAARAVIDFAAAELGITEIVADTVNTNLASMRVLHRLGFVSLNVARVLDDEPAQPSFAVASHEIDYRLDLGAAPRPATVIGILTGGQSTRMGTDKATAKVGGQTMAQRVGDACRQTGLATMVLGPDDAGTGLPNVPDLDSVAASPGSTDRQVRGPLAGLVAAMAETPGSNVILVATDQPFVMPTTLMQLALQPDADAVVPIDQGHPQVTLARYGPGVAALRHGGGPTRLRNLIDLGRAHMIDPETWETWGEDGRSFRSLDRPEDINQAVADYAAPAQEPSD